MTEILPGVHRVDGVNANSYFVLEDNGSVTLIDAGMSSGGKKVLDYLQTKLSKQPSDLKLIVLTHAHVDHIRGALAIKRQPGQRWPFTSRTPIMFRGRRSFLFRAELLAFCSGCFRYFSASPRWTRTFG